jgi:ATP-dependent exoDNAse (exonuclease V) alpha subunit
MTSSGRQTQILTGICLNNYLLSGDKKLAKCEMRTNIFPIVLAFAITVHKSQGLTLDKAVLDLGEKDFVVGLSAMLLSPESRQ